MRVLLVEANDMRQWIGGRVKQELHVVPVALLGLATYVRKAVPGVEVRIVESSLEACTEEAFTALLEDYRPQVVGLRALHFFAEEVRRLIACTIAWGGARLVVGGPMVTALRGKVFEVLPELEWAIAGEGEIPFSQFIAGESPGSIRGLLHQVRGHVQDNGAQGWIERLDELPLADYSLVDLGRYESHLSYAYNHRRQGVIVSSRGCPFPCTFCFKALGSKARMRSAKNVIEEIESLQQKHGVNDFYVVDDVFNLDRRRALEIFAGVRSLKARLYFVNGLRADLCDREFLDEMAEAGTLWVTFGVESAHPRIRALIRKQGDLEAAHRAVEYAQQCGMAVSIDTMFGFPTETPEEAKATLDWLGSLPHASLMPYHFHLRGYPECEILQQAKEAGWDCDAFLASGYRSYHELPNGTPTFPRREMLKHWLEYHQRFGLSNPEHLRWSIEVLRNISYSDADLVDMYSVLLNRDLRSVDEIVPLSRA